MTERTDHAAEARNYIACWEEKAGQHAELDMALLQAHATLALVDAQREANEQARIGNLIAFAGLSGPSGFENEVYDARLEALMSGLLDREEVPAVPGYGPGGIDERIFIRPEIAAALGIEEVKA